MSAGDRQPDDEQYQKLLAAELQKVRETIAGTQLKATPKLGNYRPVVKTLVFQGLR